MGMTIEEAIEIISDIDKAYRTFSNMEYKAMQKSIDVMRKYQQLQATYENRLKADLEAILVELQLEIEETAKDAHLNAFMNGYKDMYLNGISASAIKCSEIIQQKINSLKEA